MGEEKQKAKVLQKRSFIMDINFLEYPFFIFNNKGNFEIQSIKELESREDISDKAKSILDLVPNENKSSMAKYMSWIDSNGGKREMLMLSILELPSGFTMDVWYALIGLYIQKSSPVPYNNETRTYEIENDIMYFTFYEILKFMKLTIGGQNLNKVQNAIRQLKSTNYFSLGEGTIYNKKLNKYVVSSGKSEKGISLILDYNIDEKSKKGDKQCWVQFNRMIVDNIKYEYIKYLNPQTYFLLPSGLSRRLYGYLESNKYNSNGNVKKFIKRSYSILSYKLPVEYNYKSRFKTRLKNAIKYLIKQGIMSDYFFGDEIKINGVKEDSIYFIFHGTKEEVIDILSAQQIQMKMEIALDEEKNKDSKQEELLEIPDDIIKYLKEKGIEEKVSQSLISTYGKWEVIKYILWTKEKIKEYDKQGKTSKFDGILIYAIKSERVNLSVNYKHIVDFVEQEKQKENDKKIDIETVIQEQYSKYIEDEIENFIKEDEVMFNIVEDTVLENLQVKSQQLLPILISNLNEELKEDDREKIQSNILLWQEFNEKKNNSELFKQGLRKDIIEYKKLKMFEDFRVDFLNNKK